MSFEIWLLEMDCYKCEKEIDVVYPLGVGGFGQDWSKVGEELTEKDYCNVQKVYSQTQGKEVYGNICPHCDAYQGNHHVYELAHSKIASRQTQDASKLDGVEVVDTLPEV